MKENKNDKINFTLSIRKQNNKNKEKKQFKSKIIKDYSSLKDYKNIYQEIININMELKGKDIEIHLKNRNNELDLKEYIIYDEDDWDLLFNYNIINECFIDGNNLKI